jgi:uncharacterized protein (DUF924 family)
MTNKIISHKVVINFWFNQIDSSLWFKKDDAFDRLIKERFESIYYAATRCELYEWRNSSEGRLAEIIVLDQFSRNMFRDSAKAFQFDSLAVALTQEAIQNAADKDLTTQQKAFLYMPLMHSESLIIHELAEKVFSQPGLEYNYDFEVKHKKIIEQFGRYPHRNQILGRDSTPEEIAFLKQPGSSF